MKTFKQSAKHRLKELAICIACLVIGGAVLYFGIDIAQEDFKSRIIRFYIFKFMLIGGGLVLISGSILSMSNFKKTVFRKVVIDGESITDTFISNQQIRLDEITSGKLLRGDSSCVFALEINDCVNRKASVSYESFNTEDRKFIESFLMSKLKGRLTEERLGL